MKTHEQKTASIVAQNLREIASRMEGLGKYMRAFEDDSEMQFHGCEIENAATIAASWALEIDKKYDLRPANEIGSISPDRARAMDCTFGGLGDRVMNFIIDSGLLSTECPDAPESGCLTVWSANAAEQIETCIADLARQGTVPCPFCGHSQS